MSSSGIVRPETMPLVAAVDFAGVYDDSKTVVDRPLRQPADVVAAAFLELSLPDALAQPEALSQHRAALAAFLERWTEDAGSDMVELPAASIPAPPPGWLPHVAHPGIRRWTLHLHATWGALARQPSPAVLQRPELHTLLWVPHPFVVPGARFREVYYWDSYWVIKGLLVSGLVSIAQGIVDNMVHLVETHGYVPNGIRSYYLDRSQPPLLSEMVRVVHAAAPDAAHLARCLAALLREHAYWTSAPKQVEVLGPDRQAYRLSRYYSSRDSPRPESCREDVETAAQAGLDAAAQRRLWRELASAAESGWDFSSRWLADGRSLASIRTTQVVPADLNAFLYQMEANIAAFAAELGQQEVAARFRQAAEARRAALDALAWDAASGHWRDLLLVEAEQEQGGPYRVQQTGVVAASCWVPLFAGVAEGGSAQALQAVAALEASGLVQEGGLAAATTETGQQWDFPNVWPPLVDIAVVGARQYGGEPGARLAERLARAYLRTAHAAWERTGHMFEKFNALRIGAPGHGGEYEVVAGFGWTNGVALSLLEEYGWAEGAE